MQQTRHRNGLMAGAMMRIRIGLLAAGMLVAAVASAEVCTTQSQMTAADRDASGCGGAWFGGEGSGERCERVAGGDGGGICEGLQRDWTVVGSTAAKVKGGTLTVEQVYLLDGTQLKRGADGSMPDAQFFCSLNKSVAEADFVISGLAPGRMDL